MVNDTQFTVTLERQGGIWQNAFFGSDWNINTVTQMRLTFVEVGDATRVLAHAAIVTNPSSGFEQQTQLRGNLPRIQTWLESMATDLEKHS